MSYLALARKWRPRTFEDVVGQPHVVRALSNALGSGRVHHAFLFTGTRGVGKTTVARIFARCLNCETGVTAVPCGRCAACVAIEEGRFVDLIEVDAASRTGVDDTRELLENTQYTPASGRYKVYLIDEVHMLSKGAFNALLKTLEEPPGHVKFLFATTDPQRLPVTVLSRCLQFNLKRLPTQLIIERLARICGAENIQAEQGALARIGRAAAGSMRDGLSLLDQAIAYGNETLRDADVAEMLGSLDRGRVLGLLASITDGDVERSLALARELDQLAPDYSAILDEIATLLQRVAVVQAAGVAALEDDEDAAELARLAAQLAPEVTQLHYQIAILGRRDLPLAPDPRVGFEMTLLRMLTFRPGTTEEPRAVPEPSPAARRPATETVSAPSAPGTAARSPGAPVSDDWAGFAASLPLEGAARQLALHTTLIEEGAGSLRLGLDAANAHWLTEQQKERLIAAIRERRGDHVRVQIEIGAANGDSVASREARQKTRELQQARAALDADPNVRELADLFGAKVIAESVRPAVLPDAQDQEESGAPRRDATKEGKDR